MTPRTARSPGPRAPRSAAPLPRALGLGLLLSLLPLAGCISTGEPEDLSASATDDEAPPLAYRVAFHDGADSVLVDLPWPGEAQHSDGSWVDGHLAFDVVARDAAGREVAHEDLYLLATGFFEGQGASAPWLNVVWVPQAEVEGEGDASGLLFGIDRRYALELTDYDGPADTAPFAMTVTGPGVATVEATLVWLAKAPGQAFSREQAREAIAAQTVPHDLEVASHGAGGHFAYAVEYEGLDQAYGMAKQASTFASQAGVDVDRDVEARYTSPSDAGGYRLDLGVTLLHRGVFDWAWTYEGAASGANRGTAAGVGHLPDVYLNGVTGFLGAGDVAPATPVDAVLRETTHAADRMLLLQVHLLLPVDLSVLLPSADFVLLDCGGPGWFLVGDCGYLGAATARTLEGVLPSGLHVALTGPADEA